MIDHLNMSAAWHHPLLLSSRLGKDCHPDLRTTLARSLDLDLISEANSADLAELSLADAADKAVPKPWPGASQENLTQAQEMPELTRTTVHCQLRP
jgi:hypothetical protein